MRPRPWPQRHACPRPWHDPGVGEPAQTGDCAHAPSIQRPCGRQQPAFRCRPPRGQPAGHAPRADPLSRRRHHDRWGDGTAAGRRVCGFPARRRHQIHAARFPRDATRRHGVRGRMPTRTDFHARSGRGLGPRRHVARNHATLDFGVPAALAVQGICGRWGQTVHERILFKGTAAANPAGPGRGGELPVSRVAIKSGLRRRFPYRHLNVPAYPDANPQGIGTACTRRCASQPL